MIRKISHCGSRSPKYVELDHFTLLFCRGRQRNIPRFKTHAQNHCFAHLTFCSNVLNKHFATVGHKLASGTLHSKLNFRAYLQGLSPTNSNSFFFDPVIPAEVNDEIVSLSYSKAHGLYSFLVRILKCASHILSSPLARIMNLSVETGTFPNKLKYAKVIPVYKTGDKLECGNYRPISLLSNINKVFEKLMFNRIKKFIANHNILSTSQ